MLTGTVFNIQRFSLHDGPGIRTTVFMKGCPLRCAWCHNPESMDARPEPLLQADRCVACNACGPVCAPGLAAPLTGDASDHPGAACARCGNCAEACPAEARQLSGETWSVDALVAEVRRDSVYHGATSGGVTFSGGEPLAAGNAPFVLACLRELRGRGVPTAVDTCGVVAPDVLDEAAQLSDLVLYDLKLMDPARHRAATGRDNAAILANLTRLLAWGHEVWVRVPLVPGETADAANMTAAAAFLAAQTRRPPVHLLPYHRAGSDKYRRLGRQHPRPDVLPPSDEMIDACARPFRDAGLTVHVGG